MYNNFKAYIQDLLNKVVAEDIQVFDCKGLIMKKILLVDDEKSIRKTFRILIEKEGYSVSTAENAMQALQLMKTEDFDLVITDTIMPKMSGLELTKTIRKDNSNIPIIVITGEPTIANKQIVYKFKATEYLPKPIKKDQLIAKIRTLLK